MDEEETVGRKREKIPSADSACGGLIRRCVHLDGRKDAGGGRRIDLHLINDERKDMQTNSRRTDWGKDVQNSNKNKNLNWEKVPLIRPNP